MANIVILGAGVMASALAMVAADQSGNTVTLVGSPLDDDIIESINATRFHPTLKVDIPESIQAIKESALNNNTLLDATIVVIGVSSPGVPWAVLQLQQSKASPQCVALVTKGLAAAKDPLLPPVTYADALFESLNGLPLLGIGGPCIARELAFGLPTLVTFAATDLQLAKEIRNVFQTDYYRVAVHPDFVSLEACAALKNFYCIGVAAMLGRWKLEGQSAKNPVAGLFNQAVLEMNLVCRWICQASSQNTQHSEWNDIAFDLPGMGDLHVTVGGGRNSKLGTLLGQGTKLSDIVEGPMKGVTVEGLDTGRQLLAGFNAAVASGALNANSLPLTQCILNSIQHDQLFDFDFSKLPAQ